MRGTGTRLQPRPPPHPTRADLGNTGEWPCCATAAPGTTCTTCTTTPRTMETRLSRRAEALRPTSVAPSPKRAPFPHPPLLPFDQIKAAPVFHGNQRFRSATGRRPRPTLLVKLPCPPSLRPNCHHQRLALHHQLAPESLCPRCPYGALETNL